MFDLFLAILLVALAHVALLLQRILKQLKLLNSGQDAALAMQRAEVYLKFGYDPVRSSPIDQPTTIEDLFRLKAQQDMKQVNPGLTEGD